MKVLVTGAAGFIGFHLSKRLLEMDKEVIGVDNLNNYYNPVLKRERLDILNGYKNFHFLKQDIADFESLYSSLKDNQFNLIVHLAAQAGVRYSLTNPMEYAKSNCMGTVSVFELAKCLNVPKVVYASSSSVYGNKKKVPLSEKDRVDRPVSLYAATKKFSELAAYTYHHIYGIEMIGLRFFTVYGEYGRPDMAYFKFANSIMKDEPIDVYNYGDLKRDFTYIDDIIDGILSAIDHSFEYEIFNLGNSNPVKLMDFISILEEHLGRKAKKNFKEMQPGDVYCTYADISKAKRLLGYDPKTSVYEGLKRFAEWFKNEKNSLV
ncbi:MAG: UDP-glucuronate 4-epimerase [Candidatus Woesearchaeota archaeon]|nr:UDP-glucuronate 4-epimerase [Candidatus Woesearchaeota archaeon]